MGRWLYLVSSLEMPMYKSLNRGSLEKYDGVAGRTRAWVTPWYGINTDSAAEEASRSVMEGFWASLVIERIASWKLDRGTIDDRHGAAAIELAHLACRRPLAIDAIAIRRWVEEIQNSVRSGPLES